MTGILKTEKTKPIPLRLYALSVAVLWSLLIALSLIWNIKIEKAGTFEAARIEARTAFEKDVIYRRWNAKNGGLYAHVTAETQPNPYLDIPERDITTPSGKKLTKINPAYMTRQVHEMATSTKGVLGHITSLNPIRPANSPDPWETQALQAFQTGVKEVSSVEKMESESYMRLMRPLLTEEGCLKCHAAQGYKLGDIRGGISVSVPMAPLTAIEQRHFLMLTAGHAVLWLVGLFGIGLAGRSLRQQLHKRKKVEEALRLNEESLAATLNSIGDAVIETDNEGRVVRMNPVAEKLTGWKFSEAKERFIDEVFNIVNEKTRKKAENPVERVLREGVVVGLANHTVLISKDDIEKAIADSGAPIRNIHGNITGVVLIFRDVTEKRRAEEQIKASLKEKEVLLREVHHRAKNNMQVIISLFRLQADKIEDKKYADMFKEGEDRIRSMALIHEQLYQSMDFANIDFSEYVRSLVNGLFVSHGVDTNKISLRIDVKDVSFDLENAIPCGLIINELVSNSLKHAFPQGKEGKINISLRSINKNELELTVYDDGIGISEELDIKQTDTMGLYLVTVLVERQLDGKIELNRTQGTQFNIKFKRAVYKPRI